MTSLRHASPRRPRRGAQRSARRRSDREAPCHAPQRGRSREVAARLAGTGASRVRTSAARRRHIQPSCVTGSTHSPATGTGAGPAHGLPNSVPGFSDRCNSKGKSVMTAYMPLLSPGISRHPPRPRSSPASYRLTAVLQTRRAATAAVRRRPSRGRYRSPPPRPVLAGPGRQRSGRFRRRSTSVAVPRVLPGFSGSSQVQTYLYLQVCECRHSN